MSNIYLDSNRIVTLKDVDKQLKRIGTWRDKISSTELTALVLSILLLLGVCGGIRYKTHQAKIKNNAVKMAIYDAMQHKSK